MLEDYLGYASLLINLSLSVVLALQIYKFMNDGELGGSFFRNKIIMFLALVISIVVSLLAVVITAVLEACGVEKTVLDYLLIPIHLCVFTLLYCVTKKIYSIMAA